LGFDGVLVRDFFAEGGGVVLFFVGFHSAVSYLDGDMKDVIANKKM
jgi:hypothetical protein